MDICGCSKTQFPLINSRIGNVHLKTVSGSRFINWVVVVKFCYVFVESIICVGYCGEIMRIEVAVPPEKTTSEVG